MRNKYLETLELQPGATKADLKAAYRRLSKRYHPDVNKAANAEEKFIEIAEAYNFLKQAGPKPHNENRRYDYDPFVSEYDHWRQAARAKAKQRAREKHKEEVEFIEKALKGFNIIALIALLLNGLLFVDYLLPRKEYNQRIKTIEMMNVNTGLTEFTLVYKGRNFDLIYFEDFETKFSSKSRVKAFDHYESATVIATLILKEPIGVKIIIDGIAIYNEPDNIYKFFITIPMVLILLAFYKFIKNFDHRLALAVLLIVVLVYQLLVFIN